MKILFKGLRITDNGQRNIISLLAIVLFASSCFAVVTNINSGATHSGIQDAVIASSSGDTLLMSTGQYTFMLIDGKNLTIIGGYTPDFSTQVTYEATILDGFSYCARFISSTSTVEGLTFTSAGQGMYVFNKSVVTARHCMVENNISTFRGAGLGVLASSTLVLEHSAVENNSATNTNGSGDGGGAFVSESTLIVSEFSIIRHNSAAEKGGGVYVASSGNVEINGKSFISANTADEAGGGVYLDGGDLLVHDGGDIGYLLDVPNSTHGNGGGIYARNSSVIFKDDFTFLLNSYSGNNGGGAYLTNSTMTFYNNADIGLDYKSGTNYAALNGGGIYAIASTVAITNANIHGSSAANFGGGIYADNSEVILFNCEVGNTNDIYTNISGADGGGVDIENGTLFISGTIFLNNQTGDDGGAIRINDSTLTITNSVLRNNIASDRGGGLYVPSGSAVVEISGCGIISNIAGNDGGGIHWDSDSNLTIRRSVINANETADDGGGIYSSGTALLQLDEVEMLRNKAVDDGGGILIYGSQMLRMTDCDIRLNEADSDGDDNGNGGGLVIKNGAHLEIIAENQVFNIGANRAEDGAGIYVVNTYSTVGIIATSGYQVTMFSNMASGDGGAIHAVNPSETTLVGDVKIAQCKADNGGGISAAEGAQVYLTEAEGYQPHIENCTAGESGGGISAVNTGTKVICDGVDFGGETDGNKSNGTGDGFGGGAVAVFDNAQFRAIDCVFEENESDSHGGAMYISNATLIVEGDVAGGVTGPLPPSLFKNNTATNSASYGGAVHVTDGGVAEFYNTAIISNRSLVGGGVYAANSSEIRFVNSLIAQNYANISLYAGGGIRLRNAVAIMEYCTIANNRSSGVEVEGGGALLVMTNCIVWGHQKFNVTTNPVQTVVFSNIQDGYPGVGNIDAPPLFADALNLNYELTAISPCTNMAVDIGIMNDCIGLARPQLGGYDMGCYEFIPEPGLGIWIFGIMAMRYIMKKRKSAW